MIVGFFAEIEAFASATIRMAIPLALAGLGETYSEKSGILNIGLEGIMLCGAFFSFITAFLTNNLALGIAAGILGGMTISSIHAFMSIRCKADQAITGLALNFLVAGLTSYLLLIVFGKSTNLPECLVVPVINIPFLWKIPFFGPVLFQQDGYAYFTIFAVIVTWVLFYRTEWGVSLHAVGEYPEAADSVGLNVVRTRYISAIVNGLFGGLAGSYLTLARLGFFMENIISGRGYIALVVVILGRRNPLGVLLASLLIGSADALQFRIQILGVAIPSQVFIMFPYIITVVVLLFSIGKSHDPSSLGIPFIRSKR
ncbi:ABC transporter permease [bacterium]|nr:ABC transporter permease [bacterium]MBU4602570.1 ABC transporter permease [bacterium]